jgi:Superinfection immunity protein
VHVLASSGSNAGGDVAIVFVILAGLFFYWLPSIIARGRHVPNLGSVFVINLFAGWTIVGWVVAIAMAARSVPPGVPEPWRGRSRGPDGRLP